MHHVKVCSGLATAAALRAVENEIPSSNDLVKKAEFDSNIAEIEKKKKKSFTTSGYNKFTKDILDAKIKEKELFKKSDISGFQNNSDLDKKIVT